MLNIRTTGKTSSQPASKVCKDCGKRKDIRFFYSAEGGVYGLRAECAECSKLRVRRSQMKKRRVNRLRTDFASIKLTPPSFQPTC
jgi:hypothetical protein